MEDVDRDVHARLTWDREADAGYLALTDVADGAAVHQRVVVNPVAGAGEVILDFDAAGRLLGVELLGSDQLPPDLRTA